MRRPAYIFCDPEPPPKITTPNSRRPAETAIEPSAAPRTYFIRQFRIRNFNSPPRYKFRRFSHAARYRLLDGGLGIPARRFTKRGLNDAPL